MRGWNPLQWLQDHGGSVGAVSTASWPQAVHGSGLVATADIARGDLLLSVPAPLSLTALPGPSEDNLHEGHRLCLRLLGERCRGPASQWHAWLSSLPTAFETPLHWPDADLEVHICTCHAHAMHNHARTMHGHAHTMPTSCTYHASTMHTCIHRAYTHLEERLRGCPALLLRAREERAHLTPMLEALDEEDQAEAILSMALLTRAVLWLPLLWRDEEDQAEIRRRSAAACANPVHALHCTCTCAQACAPHA